MNLNETGWEGVEWNKMAQDTVQRSCNKYSCTVKGIWSLTLREEHRLRVFENRLLRRIFSPKRDEVTEDWRKLHNEELNNLYSSPSIIRMIKVKED
jgi:hypothetical protein